MNPKLAPGLYIVATPIGNLGDLSPRAAGVLRDADVLCVEDSRVTGKLLRHIGARRSMMPYHDHNADSARPGLIARMGRESVALASDAGTPLISDPGYKLVRDARDAGHNVVTVPGPCAAIAGLTLAGLPTDRFLFAGFLPPKVKARADAAVARELTKAYEECVTGTLTELATRYADAPPKGEIVVVVAPPAAREVAIDSDAALSEALTRLSVGQAASEVAKMTGADRRTLYARALELKART